MEGSIFMIVYPETQERLFGWHSLKQILQLTVRSIPVKGSGGEWPWGLQRDGEFKEMRIDETV